MLASPWKAEEVKTAFLDRDTAQEVDEMRSSLYNSVSIQSVEKLARFMAGVIVVLIWRIFNVDS